MSAPGKDVPAEVVDGVRDLADKISETADRVEALEDEVPRTWTRAVVELRVGLRSDARRLRSLWRAIGSRP